jgi:hypothetical protein
MDHTFPLGIKGLSSLSEIKRYKKGKIVMFDKMSLQYNRLKSWGYSFTTAITLF